MKDSERKALGFCVWLMSKLDGSGDLEFCPDRRLLDSDYCELHKRMDIYYRTGGLPGRMSLDPRRNASPQLTSTASQPLNLRGWFRKIIVWFRGKETAPVPDLFYIQTTGIVGNCAMFWRPNGKGYTTNLDDAWKVSEAAARRICETRPMEDIPRPVTVVNSLAARHVHIDDLRQL